MQRGVAARALWLASLVALSARAENELSSSKYEHTITERSTNDSDSIEVDKISENSNVTADENTSIANRNEKSDEDVSNTEETSAASSLEPALTVSAEQAGGPARAHVATPRQAPVQPYTADLTNDNNTIKNLSDDSTKAYETSTTGGSSTMEPDSLRRSYPYISDYTTTFVPRDEIVYLVNVPGAENLIACTREGDFYSVMVRGECFMCACVRVRGRVQAACASCARCGAGPPAPPPAPLPPRVPSAPLPTPVKSCAPLPYNTPFEHPLNPCQTCVCHLKPFSLDALVVSCKEDFRCIRPLDVPALPIPSVPITTPQCARFPAGVSFPHPTAACRVCACVDMRVTCAPDPLCESYTPTPMPTVSTEPYLEQADLGPTLPKQIYPGVVAEAVVIQSSSPAPETAESFVTPAPVYPSPSPGLRPDAGIFDSTPQLPAADSSLIPLLQKPDSKLLPPSVPLITEGPIFGNEYPMQPVTGRPGDYLSPPVVTISPLIVKIPERTTTPGKYLPWPPVTAPSVIAPQRERGPLLGPLPHESCRPYPARTPFQHPWDECQLCVCAEFKMPGHISIEVNCYTKPECCITLPVTSSPLLPGQVTSSTQIIQTSTTGPQITYIEPKCRSRVPGRHFLLKCNLCVCQTVYSFVIAKCTPQPKCTMNPEDGIEIEAVAVASDQGGSYSHTLLNVPSYQSQTLMPTALLTSNANALDQIQGRGPYQNGYYPQGLYRYQPKTILTGLSSADLVPYNQNSPVNFMTASANSVTENSVTENMGLTNNPFHPSYVNYPPTKPSIALSTAQSQGSQGFYSAEAFVEAINSPYQKDQLRNFDHRYSSKNMFDQQNQPSPEMTMEASSAAYSNNQGYSAQPQSNPYQNYPTSNLNSKQTEYAHAIAGLRDFVDSYSNANTYSPYSSTPSLISTESATNSNTYPYPVNLKSFYSTPGQPLWDSSTLASNQGDSSTMTQAQALAAVGAVRTGRGQCQYAGDRYHSRCQACSCFADEARPGELYSMCLGKPCK